jgi:hypothetical protein
MDEDGVNSPVEFCKRNNMIAEKIKCGNTIFSKVDYTEEPLYYDGKIIEEETQAIAAVAILMNKTNPWRYEQECRFIIKRNTGGYVKIGEIREIILGSKFMKKYDKAVSELARLQTYIENMPRKPELSESKLEYRELKVRRATFSFTPHN